MKCQNIEANILQKYFTYLKSFEPILSKIKVIKTLHTGGYRYQIENREAFTPQSKLSFIIEISISTVYAYDVEAFTKSIYDFVVDQMIEMRKLMFKMLNVVTGLTGNVVDAKGQPFNADLYLDGIEIVDLEFDENGMPTENQFITDHPLTKKQLENLRFTPAQLNSYNQIIERKKKEFYAKKRYRRLSYID